MAYSHTTRANGLTLTHTIYNADHENHITRDTLQTGYIRLHDSKATTTDGGTFTQDAWQKRTVTEDQDTQNFSTVTSSVIVLTAGTYDCLIRCPGKQCANHQAKLENTTSGSPVLIGGNTEAVVNNASTSHSVIQGRFTITASQNLEIQHRCSSTKATTGFGEANSFGENEIYTVAEFWRID